MKHSLDRVLRIRKLLEDLSRLELEKRAAAKRQLEKGAERQRQLALRARAEALKIAGGCAGEGAWLLGIADADLLAWKGGRLRALAEAGRPAVEAARAEMLARRLDRRQTETLIAAAAAAEDKASQRRAQRQVDDWFQSRRGRRRDE